MKMKISIFKCYFSLLIVLLLCSCREDTTIGQDIVGGEGLDVNFESFALPTNAKSGYVPTIHYSGLNEPAHLLGQIKDPYLGLSTAKLYFNYFPAEKYDFAEATIDSVVLSVKVDTANIVGGFTQDYSFDVSALETNIVKIDTIYNDTPIATKAKIGNLSGSFDFSKKSVYFSVEKNKLDTVATQIRVPLDNSFGQNLMTDISLYDDPAAFYVKNSGLVVSATPQNSHMLSILMDATTNGTLTNNNIEIYYTKGDAKKVAKYRIGTANFSMYDIDHSGSPSVKQLEQGNKDYFYQQTLGGAYGEFMLPDLSKFDSENIIINSAVVEINQAILPDDTDAKVYPYLSSYYLNQIKNSKEVVIEDISKFSSFNQGITNHGGSLTDKMVKFNCTDQVRNYIKGKADNKLIIKNLGSTSKVGKAIFYGETNTEKAPKLKITYTKI